MFLLFIISGALFFAAYSLTKQPQEFAQKASTFLYILGMMTIVYAIVVAGAVYMGWVHA